MARQVVSGKDGGASALAGKPSYADCVYAEYVWLDACQTPRSKTMTMTSRPSTPEDLRVWNYDGSSTGQAEGTNSEVLLYPRSVFHDPFLGDPHVLVLAEAYNAWDGKPSIGNTRAECAVVMEQYAGFDPLFGIEQEYTLMRPGLIGQKATSPLGFNEDGSEPAPQGPYYTSVGTGVAVGRPVAEEHYVKCFQAGVKIAGMNAEVMPGQWEFQIGPCRGVEMGDHLTMARYIMLRITEQHNCVVSFDPKPIEKGDWNGAGCHTNFSVAPMLQPGGYDVIIKVCQAFGSFVKEHIAEYGDGNDKRLTGKHETCDINTFRYGVADRGASIRIPRDAEKDGKGYMEDRRPAANCDPYRVTSRIMKTTGWCLGAPNALPRPVVVGCVPYRGDEYTVGKDAGALTLAQKTSYQACVLAEYVWLDAFGVTRSKSMTMTSRPSNAEDCRVWNYDGSSTGQAEGHNSEVLLHPRAVFNDPFRGAPHVLVLAEARNAWDSGPAIGNARAECAAIMEKCQALDPWFGIEQEYTLMRRTTIGRKSCMPLGFNADGTEPAPQGPYYTGVGIGAAIARPVADEHYMRCLEAGVKISGINAEVMPGQWEFQIGPCRGIEMGDHLTMARYILLRVSENYKVVVSFDPKPQEGDWNGAGCHTNFSIAPMRQDGGYEAILKVCEAFGRCVKEHIAAYGAGNEKRLTGKHETCDINQFKFGVANRGASIRIPRDAEKEGKGYLEDRRPAANCDPYLVTTRMMKTTLQCLQIPAFKSFPTCDFGCLEFKSGCHSVGKDRGPAALAHMNSFMACVLAEYVWLDVFQKPRSKTMTMTNRPSRAEDCRVWNYDGSSTGQAEGHNSEVLLYPRAVFHDPFRGAPHVLVLAEAYNAWDCRPASGNTRAACATLMETYRGLDPWFGIEQEYTLMRPGRIGEASSVPLGFNEDGTEPAPQGPYYTGVGIGVAIGRPVADDHYMKCIEAGVKISGINAEVMPGQWEFQIGPCKGIEMGDHLTMARYIMYRVTEEHNCVVSFDPKPREDGDWNGAGCHTNFSVAPMLQDDGYHVIIKVCEAFGKVAKDHIAEYGDGNEKRLTGKHETCDINTFKYGVANRGASIRIPRDVEKDGKGYMEDRRPAANCDPYRVTARMLKTTGECLGIPAIVPPALTSCGACAEFRRTFTTGKDQGPAALAQMTSFQTCVLAEYVWLDAFHVPRSKTMTMTHRPTKLDDLRVWNYDGSSTGQAEGHNSEVLLYPRAVFHDPFRGAPHVLVLAEAYNAWDGQPSIGNTRAECAEIMEKYRGLDPWFGIEQEYTLMRPARIGEKSAFPLGFNEDGSEPAPQGPYYCGAGSQVAMGRAVADDHYTKCIQAGVKISGINAEVMPGQWEFQIGPCRGIEMGDHLTMARYIMLRVSEHKSCAVSFDPKPREGDWNGAGCHTNFSVSPMLQDGGYDIILQVCEAFGKVTSEHIAEYGVGNEKRLTGRHETCDINTFRYGVADRGASIRIPRDAEKDGKGYMEDRRPAANCDPYRVTTRILKTAGECLGIPRRVPLEIRGVCAAFQHGSVVFGKDHGASALARMTAFQECVLAEYVWPDANQVPRSKTMTMTRRPTTTEDLRVWNYDGSSTGQADGNNSEVLLYPRVIFDDPFRGAPHIMVLCEACNAWNGKPSIGNTRAECAAVMEKYKGLYPWFGIEQEYTLMRPAGIGEKARVPLGFNDDGGEPAPQGPYYTGAGTTVAIGRPIADEHKLRCLQAGVKITGINAEVMPGQWEFQVGPCQGIEMGDHLTMARYILLRVSEIHGVVASFDPKPANGDWNGAGCHTNFSVAPMRSNGGYEAIIQVCKAFGNVSKEHILEYGDGNEKRLTGKHETCDINTFKFGVANRAASIRIPRDAEKDGKGYMEDRRPSANCDPYRVTSCIMRTAGQCLRPLCIRQEVSELQSIVQSLVQDITGSPEQAAERATSSRLPRGRTASKEVSQLRRDAGFFLIEMRKQQDDFKVMLQALVQQVDCLQLHNAGLKGKKAAKELPALKTAPRNELPARPQEPQPPPLPPPRYKRPSMYEASSGWIDNTKIDAFLADNMRVIAAVDGSLPSMAALEYALKCVAINSRTTFLNVLHLYDNSKEYLRGKFDESPTYRREHLRETCDNLCASHLNPSRYRLTVIPRAAEQHVGTQLVEEILALEAHFIVMGAFGRKGSKRWKNAHVTGAGEEPSLSSNVMEVMQHGRCSCVVLQTGELQGLPVSRPTIFVVSVSLNAAATKSFIDALRLSKAGDAIHVVYVKSYMEETESDYTCLLREKYLKLFLGLKDSRQEILSKFGDRAVQFRVLEKGRKEVTSTVVVRYADSVEADFIVVGTNAMRVGRGKPVLGSVSLQICLETSRNFVVSNFSP